MEHDGVVGKAQEAARETNDHPVVRAAARVGYAASGVIHLLIAWIALQVAMGGSKTSADQSSAMSTIAKAPWGASLLWILVVGFVGLALWQLTEAIGGWHGSGKDAVFSRIKAVSKAVVYVALGWTAATIARGKSSNGATQSAQTTGDILALPGGKLLVILIGLVVVGVGIYHIVKGLRKSFLQDLVDDPGDIAVTAGMIGYPAKGIALIIVGGLFVLAGASGRAAESQGRGGALALLIRQPFGPWLLAAVAVGIGCYGLYSFFRARHTKV
ncbi:MAG: DUF1206 domain-containing protein [Micrococcales bacterium]|nr:DUF1206 domain-containing protein [Micrococcales bacterium]